jgi:FMN-dependent NADH-azoreductase
MPGSPSAPGRVLGGELLRHLARVHLSHLGGEPSQELAEHVALRGVERREQVLLGLAEPMFQLTEPPLPGVAEDHLPGASIGGIGTASDQSCGLELVEQVGHHGAVDAQLVGEGELVARLTPAHGRESLMTLFRVDSSIRPEGSASREVADTLQRAYLDQHPHDTVVQRDLVADPIPAEVWSTAALAGFTPAEERTDAQRDALALAARLADELLAADAAVIATPLYNFGVSQHLKSWIDLLITDPRFAPGTRPLDGRPVALVVSRGGSYRAGTPREGWDYATGYLRRILADVWGADVTLVEVELTLADVNPAMAELRPLAATSRAEAHQLAEDTGRAYAQNAAAAA